MANDAEAPQPSTQPANGDARSAAVKRIKEKRDFRTHVAVYLIVNLFLIGIWWFSGRGYFWPIWVILGWGVGVALNAWQIFFDRPISDEDIEREMRRSA
jgi:hypothetical protein